MSRDMCPLSPELTHPPPTRNFTRDNVAEYCARGVVSNRAVGPTLNSGLHGRLGNDRKTPIAWSDEEADRLRHFASSPEIAETRVELVTARALQFLLDHANGTAFERTAIAACARWQDHRDPVNAVAFQLEEWATYQESGMAGQKPFGVRFRIEAATDIMEQVQLLLKDPDLHPAAAVVLAGAALEEFLRSMQVDSGQPMAGKPCISEYAAALAKADLLTRREVKERYTFRRTTHLP